MLRVPLHQVDCIVVMRDMTPGNRSLRRFDLTLVNALTILLDEGSVTAVAKRLGVTQPAPSRMLARLRDMFEDPLLGKAGRSMMPTPRATAFHLPLRHPMIDVANMIRPAEFDPREASAVIGIAATDAAIESVVTSRIRDLAVLSPGLRFEIGAIALETPEARSRGDVDFAVDVYPDPIEGFHVSHLYFDRFVCVLRKHHPAARSRLTRRVYRRLHHLGSRAPAAEETSSRWNLRASASAEKSPCGCPQPRHGSVQGFSDRLGADGSQHARPPVGEALCDHRSSAALPGTRDSPFAALARTD